MKHLTLVIIAITTAIGTASATDLTVYRSDDSSLYAPASDSSASGYAMVREPRSVDLRSGSQSISLGGLPLYLDSEALALSFANDAARVVSQRLRLAQGDNALLGDLVGKPVEVIGDSGQTLIEGTLVSAGSALVVRDAQNRSSVIQRYAAIRAAGAVEPGATLDLQVDAKRSGTATAQLSYTTAGMGWRASYVGTLSPGSACRMSLQSRASLANRSGRNWKQADLTLIAGEPNRAKPTAPSPRPMMMMKAARAEAQPMPQQSSLGDYRSYRLPDPVDLPDGSVSLLPLYATRTIDCVRTLLYENGRSYEPQQPILGRDFLPGSNSDDIASTLRFTAFDSLPAGYLRVLTADARGVPQFIGEDRIEDTPKGQPVTLTLGTSFDLKAKRERTAFKVDKNGRTLDEAFRLILTNGSDSARTVTVREYPSRWREWSLVSSSSKPSKKTADTLEFRVQVPAGGKTNLDYAVHYHWTADDEGR